MAIAGIIGKKVGMTQVFAEDGALVPVTVIQAGPCLVVQKKTDREGRLRRRPDRPRGEDLQPRASPARRADTSRRPACRRCARSSSFAYEGDANVGDRVQVDIFKAGDSIDVVGQSKGKGFQGVMKRHHFGGGRPRTARCSIALPARSAPRRSRRVS